uniref:Toxoplasma gondii family A protein n=1 Tax=Neospora caninum (strain Liverpool) TaxID=572307 RepID=F0JAX9_NEOCL|nr:hypothetical protein NCLIV_069060 [Neospora caninum Liverpool]CEL71245.1 TPA: hypothetical protein BN1204_069060 [Neospora caninum Liverpool]
MERQIFRAACLILLTSTVLSCVASETSEQNPAANFTTTIPKEGLERDVEQVFYLGPSSTLQVIDETGKAKYLPEPSQSDDEASSGPYTAAYLFENGACDFTQTVDFKDAFQGYTKPPWVADEKGSGASGESSSGGPVRYTFTNPSAEYLGGGSSFCVRFKTVLAAGSESQTSSSTTRTAGTSGEQKPGDSVSPEENGIESPGPGPQPEGSPSEDNSGADGVLNGSQPGPDGAEGNDKAERPPSPPNDSSFSSSDGNIQETLPELQVGDANHKVEGTLPTAPDNVGPTHSGMVGDDLQHRGVSPQSGSRLRRLSETPLMKDAFLTIVVHSGTWGFAGGMGALSIFIFSVAAALLLIA